MPGAGRTHGPPADKKAGGSHHGDTRHSPRDGLNGCFAFSPVLRACWPPLRMMLSHRRVISASGYQDHATWPCASLLFVGMETTLQHRHAHRIPPQRSW